MYMLCIAHNFHPFEVKGWYHMNCEYIKIHNNITVIFIINNNYLIVGVKRFLATFLVLLHLSFLFLLSSKQFHNRSVSSPADDMTRV